MRRQIVGTKRSFRRETLRQQELTYWSLISIYILNCVVTIETAQIASNPDRHLVIVRLEYSPSLPGPAGIMSCVMA